MVTINKREDAKLNKNTLQRWTVVKVSCETESWHSSRGYTRATHLFLLIQLTRSTQKPLVRLAKFQHCFISASYTSPVFDRTILGWFFKVLLKMMRIKWVKYLMPKDSLEVTWPCSSRHIQFTSCKAWRIILRLNSNYKVITKYLSYLSKISAC